MQQQTSQRLQSVVRIVIANMHSSSATQQPNVIQVPKRIANKIETLQKTRGPIKWRGRVFNARPGKELISAKRKEFNYYQNQTYDKFKPPKLASDGWKQKQACGDHFTILAYRGNPSVQDNEDGSTKPMDFESLTLNKTLLDTLGSMDVRTPTRIQTAAIPSILKGRNVLCAAETGSGKTLAYLLPIMHLLLWETATQGTVAAAGRPRCLVLVPAWELAEQIKFVAKMLLKNTSMNVRHLDGNKVNKTLKHTFLTAVDVIVSTPGPVLNCLRRKFMSLESVTHIVIDEADTMLDDSFCSTTLNILGKVHNIAILHEERQTNALNLDISQSNRREKHGFTVKPFSLQVNTLSTSRQKPFHETQLILAGATMPRQAAETLKDILPERALETIVTPHLHRIMPHVNQKFLRLHSQDKAATILGIVTRDSKQKVPVMIFCNEIATCNWLAWFLEESNIKVLRLNGDMDPEQRQGVIHSFQKGVSNVLVCTDIGSRGMDMVQVRHVVNFDFPNFMSDYIHRVGRVGRVSSSGVGHVTNFVVQKWDVDLVKKIESRESQREPSRVDANIKHKHMQRLADNDDTNFF